MLRKKCLKKWHFFCINLFFILLRNKFSFYHMKTQCNFRTSKLAASFKNTLFHICFLLKNNLKKLLRNKNFKKINLRVLIRKERLLRGKNNFIKTGYRCFLSSFSLEKQIKVCYWKINIWNDIFLQELLSFWLSIFFRLSDFLFSKYYPIS